MGIKETLHNLVHREQFNHVPTPDELKEPQIVGGVVDLWERQEAEIEARQSELQRPVDLTPYESQQVRHFQERRSMRRVTKDGKR